MASLRDVVADDLDHILPDSDEFGGTVTVDGVDVDGVLDEDTTGGATKTGAGRDVDGTYIAEWVLRVKSSDVPRPKFGKRMTVDGGKFFVVHTGESMGLLVIRLQEFES